MITIDEFQAMDMNEKKAAVERGSFLAERKEDQIIIRLYSFGSFFVESFFDPARNRVLHYIAFKSNNLLLPYIKKR